MRLKIATAPADFHFCQYVFLSTQSTPFQHKPDFSFEAEVTAVIDVAADSAVALVTLYLVVEHQLTADAALLDKIAKIQRGGTANL